ncbi:MAG: ferric iron uptake transcriptional regulator [Hydrogenophilus sp.]|nr:ferric iron uptake transcriptional regulator [Hydrogenophilus sp.]
MEPNHTLRDAGLKTTYPRLKILELFSAQGGRHLSADEIYRQLRDQGVDLGLATVYRVLTQFEQAGVLLKHYFDGHKAVYELTPSRHHDHLLCLDCGQIIEFSDDAIEARQRAIAETLGFSLQGHALSLYGRCTKPDCPRRPR